MAEARALHVLCLIFNEGYSSSEGPNLQRTDLSSEAIRLARAVYSLLPGDTEIAGLLALMLLTDARRLARTGPEGQLIPLEEQIGACGIDRPSPKGRRSSLTRCGEDRSPERDYLITRGNRLVRSSTQKT